MGCLPSWYFNKFRWGVDRGMTKSGHVPVVMPPINTVKINYCRDLTEAPITCTASSFSLDTLVLYNLIKIIS